MISKITMACDLSIWVFFFSTIMLEVSKNNFRNAVSVDYYGTGDPLGLLTMACKVSIQYFILRNLWVDPKHVESYFYI